MAGRLQFRHRAFKHTMIQLYPLMVLTNGAGVLVGSLGQHVSTVSLAELIALSKVSNRRRLHSVMDKTTHQDLYIRPFIHENIPDH